MRKRRRRIQASITIGAVMLVTILFVINILSASSNLVGDERPSRTATQDETVWTEVPADVISVDPVTFEPEIVEYIPDVSGIEETYISDEAYSACIRYGAEYGIASELLMAMIEIESQGDPQAFNGTDYGLMQVAQKWHYDRMKRLGAMDLFDTDQNIHVGTDYLAELFNEYEDVGFVLMIYNMGYNTAEHYYNEGIISEYAQSVTARADELTILHTYGGVN